MIHSGDLNARKWYAADDVLRITGNVSGHVVFTVNGDHYLGEGTSNDGGAELDLHTQVELYSPE